MKWSSVGWLGSAVALMTCALVYYFGFARHGKAGVPPAIRAANTRKTLAAGPVEARRMAAWDLALTPHASNREALEKALTDQDLEVKRTAVLGLGWLKDPNSLPALVQMSKDPDTSTRKDVAWALGQLPNHVGYDALATLVHDRASVVSEAAIAAVGGLAFPAAEDAINPSAVSDFERKHALSSLIQLKAPSVLEALEYMAREDLQSALEFTVRVDQCHGIPFLVGTAATRDEGQIDETAARFLREAPEACVIDSLLGELKGEAPTRRQVVKFLLALGGPRAAEALIRLEKDPDARVAKLAADGLAESFKDRRLTVPEPALLAKSSNPKDLDELSLQMSRARILRVLVGAGLVSPGGYLGWLERARADLLVPLLLDRLVPNGAKDWPRRAAILATADESALPALTEAAKSPDAKRREFVAEVLVGVAHPDARALLRTLTQDPEPRVRRAAWQLYRRVAKPEAEAGLVALLAGDQPKDWELAYAVLQFDFGPAAFARGLEDLESSDSTRRTLATGLLVTVNRAQALELLRRLASTPKLRGPILEVLRKFKVVNAVAMSRADVIPVVVSMLSDSDPNVREGMACVLSQLSGLLNPRIESEYRRQGAATSLGKLLTSGTETGQACAQQALAAIGDDRGLLPLVDAIKEPSEWMDLAPRLAGRVTVALANKLIHLLSPDVDTRDSYIVTVLKTASPEVLSQSYVPAICAPSSTDRARVERSATDWGLPRGIAKLPPGSARDCLVQWIRTALAGGVEKDQVLAAKLAAKLQDRDLVDAMLAFTRIRLQGDAWEAALAALVEIGDPRALDLVLKAVSSAKPPGVAVFLLAKYDEDEPRVRAGLLSAFANNEHREWAVGRLVGRLPDEQWLRLGERANSGCYERCSGYLARALSKVHGPVAATALGESLHNPNAVADNVSLLGDHVSNETLLSLLAAVELREVPREMRRWKSPQTIAQLRAALGHTSPNVRGNAARILADWNAPDVLEPIAALLDDSISRVRVAAAESLGGLEDPKALPYLGDLLATWLPQSSEFQAGLCAWASLRKDAAAQALARYTSLGYPMHNTNAVIGTIISTLGCTHSAAAVPQLAAYLEMYSSNATLVIQALGATRQTAAAAPLLRLWAEGRESVDVLKALGELGSPDALAPLLVELNQPVRLSEDAQRRELFGIISRYQDRRAVDALIQALVDADCEDLDFYASTLAKTHDQRAVEPLQRAGKRCQESIVPYLRELESN